MSEVITFIIAIIILALGFPLGNLLAKLTKEELKVGRKWFNVVIILSIIGAIYSLIIGNDYLLFTFLFISIITSRSLIVKK